MSEWRAGREGRMPRKGPPSRGGRGRQGAGPLTQGVVDREGEIIASVAVTKRGEPEI